MIAERGRRRKRAVLPCCWRARQRAPRSHPWSCWVVMPRAAPSRH